MSNIPFLAEEGNVIEGLHFDSYLGWGEGGKMATFLFYPPPSTETRTCIFKHTCTPHTKKGITQVHKYYANQVHTHTSTQSYMNPLYKSFTQIVYEYGHHVSDPVSTGPRGRQQVHRRKLRIDRSRHLVYRKESN